MIETYTDYIDRYLSPTGLGGATLPGEHHFVSVYLLPKLYSLNGIVPDYVNPDGMKGVIGDIAYLSEGEHFFGIEVKLGTVSLSENEYNNWIVNGTTSMHPDVFIGIGTDGIGISSWASFRNAYARAIGCEDLEDLEPISGKYGPRRLVNRLLQHMTSAEFCKRGSDEKMFEDRLREATAALDRI